MADRAQNSLDRELSRPKAFFLATATFALFCIGGLVFAIVADHLLARVFYSVLAAGNGAAAVSRIIRWRRRTPPGSQ